MRALFVKIERPILVGGGTRYMSFESLSPTFFHLFNSRAFEERKKIKWNIRWTGKDVVSRRENEVDESKER